MKYHHAVVAAACLCFSAVALSQSGPVLGTYASADGNFVLKIAGANPGNGLISGSYEARSSPVGAFVDPGRVGRFAWVVQQSPQRDGLTPFGIRFGGQQRPDGWPYLVQDVWNGAYLVDNSIVAQGSRSYVSGDGTVQVDSLGKQVFRLQN